MRIGLITILLLVSQWMNGQLDSSSRLTVNIFNLGVNQVFMNDIPVASNHYDVLYNNQGLGGMFGIGVGLKITNKVGVSLRMDALSTNVKTKTVKDAFFNDFPGYVFYFDKDLYGDQINNYGLRFTNFSINLDYRHQLGKVLILHNIGGGIQRLRPKDFEYVKRPINSNYFERVNLEFNTSYGLLGTYRLLVSYEKAQPFWLMLGANISTQQISFSETREDVDGTKYLSSYGIKNMYSNFQLGFAVMLF